ncbi:MAG: hypothetical protein LH477_07025 [Nocardioides sp.]|nr:hypothetical protein [Nocardioides sp.]
MDIRRAATFFSVACSAILSSVLLASVALAGQVPATAALPVDGQALDVLVVGDSYSAGNGASGTTSRPG